jgi:hypothetical protein
MEHALDLMLRQAQNSQASHALIETLIEALAETGAIDADRLRELWRERCQLDEPRVKTSDNEKSS